jgi:hypothetical protein
MSHTLPRLPEPWYRRCDGWFQRKVFGTSGDDPGASGSASKRLLRAYGVIALLLIAVDTVNVFTVQSDASRHGSVLPLWEVMTWEATSGVSELLVCVLIYLALRAASPVKTNWGQAALVHAAASVIFSIAHVSLMVALRAAIYASVGDEYRFGAPEWLYEYRKDILAYVLLGGIFWRFMRPLTTSKAVPMAEPPIFDILDGQNLTRTPVSEILAVKAAGNYVEFHFVEDRTLLMRSSLREVEVTLTPLGFVRTHRSWVVNRAHVRAIASCGSGDFELRLERGPHVPVSRRYRAAVSALRG